MRCPRCRYPLAVTSVQRCPECGAEYDPAHLTPDAIRARRLSMISVILYRVAVAVTFVAVSAILVNIIVWYRGGAFARLGEPGLFAPPGIGMRRFDHRPAWPTPLPLKAVPYVTRSWVYLAWLVFVLATAAVAVRAGAVPWRYHVVAALGGVLALAALLTVSLCTLG
jgi:hypothetical protein